jgi:hypothetical protein
VIYEEKLGTDHPDVARTLTGLASVDRDRGKYAEAEAHYKRAPGESMRRGMSISASRSIFPAMRVISAKSMPIPKNCRPSFGPPSCVLCRRNRQLWRR